MYVIFSDRLRTGGGFAEKEAVRARKEYLTGAIAAGLDLGHGNGRWILCTGCGNDLWNKAGEKKGRRTMDESRKTDYYSIQRM